MTRLIIFVLLFLMVLSCQDNNCGPFESTRYDITEIIVTPVVFEELPVNIGTPVTTTVPNTFESINSEKFILELSATVIKDPTYVENKLKKEFQFSFSLINSAHACSPPAPYTNEKIKVLNITSNQDFSDNYPAGTNLNSLFSVEYNDLGVYKNDGGSTRSAFRLDEYVELKPNAGQLLQLKLNQKPGPIKSHEFHIEYIHDDDEYFFISIPVITFE
jgi:hypothetical protein